MNESKARAEEAGDEDTLPLSKVFIDQNLRLDQNSIPQKYEKFVAEWSRISSESDHSIVPSDLQSIPSSFAMLLGGQEKTMLLAGPGYGKSTITQFLTLYHASRIIRHDQARILAGRLKLPKGWDASNLDSSVTIRYPFRIELRRYSKWRRAQNDSPVGIATYIATHLIGQSVESSLNSDDIFQMISENPTLLILDGLDEVPKKDEREHILADCDAFLYRCQGEDVDLQVIMSSRPQGYNGEFDRFLPLRWVINDLDRSDFDYYSASWLEQRIRNSDERSEAAERVQRGMSSEAIQQLATTLLQATVMLTIAKRKNDIPDERFKLFEKYVDVIFEREKIKSELIATYEKELRLLHEIAGYRIHESVGKGLDGNLNEEQFKDLIAKVWRLVRGDDLFHGILNVELDRIFDLAKDRLVFLTGRGDNQSEIDFTIQSYREYFAANYCSNHVQAEPERVFRVMADHGAYWQNVLKFYSANALPAQQLGWGLSVVFENPDNCAEVSFSETLLLSRAILYTLPEFGRLQYEQIQRTIRGAIPVKVWWTYLNQPWAISILSRLKNGAAWKEMWRSYRSDDSGSYGATLFALHLFPASIGKNIDIYPEFIRWIEGCCNDPLHFETAISESIANDLEVDFSNIGDDFLFPALKRLAVTAEGRQTLPKFDIYQRLDDKRIVRFMCTTRRGYLVPNRKTIWHHLGIPFVYTPQSDFEVKSPGEFTIWAPTWTRVSFEGEAQLLFEESDDPYRNYIVSLYRALLDPEDPSLHEQSLILMNALTDPPIWNLECEFVLGPPPSAFSSREEWVSFKQIVGGMFRSPSGLDEIKELLAELDQANSNMRWLTLFFPPAAWSDLVASGLLTDQNISGMRESPWAKAAALQHRPLEIFTFSNRAGSLDKQNRVSFVDIFKLAVKLHGQGVAVDSRLVSSAAQFSDLSELTWEDDLKGLFELIQDCPDLPSSWLSAFFQAVWSVDLPSFKALVELWVAHNGDENQLWSSLHALDNVAIRLSVCQKLLALDSESGWNLLACIGLRWGSFPDEISKTINRLAASRMLDDNLSEELHSSLMRSVTSSEPTTHELILYSESTTLGGSLTADPYLASEISYRIQLFSQQFQKDDYAQAASSLRMMIERRHLYPPKIAATAIDALLQIEISDTSPLLEADWQI